MELGGAYAEPSGRVRLKDCNGRDSDERGSDHLSSAVRANDPAPGMTAAASAFSHCSMSEQ